MIGRFKEAGEIGGQEEFMTISWDSAFRSSILEAQAESIFMILALMLHIGRCHKCHGMTRVENEVHVNVRWG